MGLILLVIGVVVGSEWYKNNHRSVSNSSYFSGAPAPQVLRPYFSGVPVAQVQPITEAAYNQYPTGEVVVPVASSLDSTGEEYLVI